MFGWVAGPGGPVEMSRQSRLMLGQKVTLRTETGLAFSYWVAVFSLNMRGFALSYCLVLFCSAFVLCGPTHF